MLAAWNECTKGAKFVFVRTDATSTRACGGACARGFGGCKVNCPTDRHVQRGVGGGKATTAVVAEGQGWTAREEASYSLC